MNSEKINKTSDPQNDNISLNFEFYYIESFLHWDMPLGLNKFKNHRLR